MSLILTRASMRERLEQAFPLEQAEVLVDIFDEIRHIEIRHDANTQDLKQGLRELTQEVKNLVAAQQHTDERLAKFEARTEQRFQRTDERIAKFEERTEQRFQRTDEKLAELATAQQRTDERLVELTAAQQRTDERLAELAAAQQRTDERLAKFEERTERRFQRTDEQLAELAAAQQRTDESIAELSREMRTGFKELRQAIGGLANRFGFDLEEFVAALLPPYIERHAEVTGLMLERRYFELPDGQQEEVDLVGSGQQKGKPVMVLAECRTTIGGGEMRRLADKLTRVAETLPENVLKIVVTMNLHPTGEEAARETGIWAIPYSRINRERGYDRFP